MRGECVVIACWVAMFGCGGEADIDVGRRSSVIPTPGESRTPDAGANDAAGPSLPPTDPPEPPPFDEPGCPPARVPPELRQCDPLAPVSGCPADQACFPIVNYPTGPCEVELFGTVCLPAGPGTQGDPCSTEGCAADHICVSTGRGTQCVRLCGFGPAAPSVCAPGLLCLPIDIEGFGGCL
jgi:hypothetical protein